MTAQTTDQVFTDRRASDYGVGDRFLTRDGSVVYPHPDGCWVTTEDEHRGAVLSLTEPEAAPIEPEVPAALVAQIEELTDKIAALEEQNATLTSQAARLTARNTEVSENLRVSEVKHERVRDAIIAEAQERSWCDEVNDFLEGVGYERWEVDLEVVLTYTIQITQSACVDRDDAIDRATDMLFSDRYAYAADAEVNDA